MSAADNADPRRAAPADRAAGSRRPPSRAPRTADLPQQAFDAYRAGDYDNAERLYRMLLHREPGDAIALNNLGILMVQRGRREPGEELIRKAVAAKPDYAVAHSNLGTLLRERGDIDAAITAFEQAVAAKPDYAEAHFNLALSFEKKGNTDEAVAAFERAVASKPAYPEAHFYRANALKKKGDLGKAIAAYREATALKPDFGDAYANLGIALAEASELDEAATAYRRALEIKPENHAAHANLGNLLIDKGDVDAAIAEYRQAIAISPDWAHAHFGLSLALLQKGNHAEAWREYEWRWKGAVEKIKPRDLPKPQWQGEDFSGKTLLIYAEQGLGDTLQFVRFVPSLAARGGRVVLEVPGKLLSLLRTSGVAETMVAAGAGLPEFDFHLPLLSLPSVIGLTEESIPAEIPYLAADPARVALWHERLPKGGFRVGIVWQGFPNAAIDKGRSIPLRCFAPLAAVREVRLISLQKNYGLDQLDALPQGMRVETLGPDFDAGPDAFLDTAAVMVDLDLVITSDTSVAHLAGALGRPVWLVLKSNPDWRWLLRREDSPWYPTARLFRQRKRGDWDEVMERVAAELAQATAGNTEKLFAPGKMPPADDRAHRARAAFGRGFALHQEGSLDEAAAAYSEAATLDPNHAEAYSNLGVIRHGSGRIDEAITLYRRAVAIKPDHVAALGNLAVALSAKGDVDGAIAALRRALAGKPDDAEGHLRLGDLYRRKGDVDGAVDAYRQAAVIKPDDPKAQFNLAFGLQTKGELDSAIGGYRRAIALDPGLAQADANLGVALVDAGRIEEGIAECRQALALQPDNSQYLSNLGLALSKADDVDGALEHYRRAVEIDPDYAEGHANLALAVLEKGRVEEAIACDRRAILLKPDYATAHFNLSLALLLNGEFGAGWQEYEWRWKGGVKDLKAPEFAQPRWQGEDLAGKTLLLQAEQGLGDTLQFARFAPALAARGARIILTGPRELVALLRSTPGVEAVVGVGEKLPRFDFHLPLMSVPAVLGTTETTIPAHVPYLAADPERVAFWRTRLPADGFRVGIVWQGRPDAPIDKGRSVPLRAFAPLAAVPGVRLISLQKSHGLDQLARLPEGMRVETLGADFDGGPDAFLDTAAIMESLDLVITSDTSVAHLAGALGRPVWIALKSNPDWRWLIGREDSPWYPTARLFRQHARGDWDEVFERIAGELTGVVAGDREWLLPERSARPHPDHARVFDHIYTDNLWGVGSGSGSGSTEESTRQYRWFLQNFLKSNKIKSVLDLGCGDWQFSKHIDWTGIDYLGVDVSPVVLENTKTFTRPGIAFRELNAVTDGLPPADLVIAKDVLQHWCNADILALVAKLSSFRMALITNGFHPAGLKRVNLDIKPGGWRPVDLRGVPFNLPGSYVYWFNGGEPKYVFLWSNPASGVKSIKGSAADEAVRVPIAIGELADKITILEIKAERITDAAKLRNVGSELDQLRAVWDRRGPRSAAVEPLTRELKKINESLWAIEDEIRDCERQRDFGPQFVALARAVYRTNDRRAEIKREINLSAGSNIIEEKSYRAYQSEEPDSKCR